MYLKKKKKKTCSICFAIIKITHLPSSIELRLVTRWQILRLLCKEIYQGNEIPIMLVPWKNSWFSPYLADHILQTGVSIIMFHSLNVSV